MESRESRRRGSRSMRRRVHTGAFAHAVFLHRTGIRRTRPVWKGVRVEDSALTSGNSLAARSLLVVDFRRTRRLTCAELAALREPPRKVGSADQVWVKDERCQCGQQQWVEPHEVKTPVQRYGTHGHRQRAEID